MLVTAFAFVRAFMLVAAFAFVAAFMLVAAAMAFGFEKFQLEGQLAVLDLKEYLPKYETFFFGRIDASFYNLVVAAKFKRRAFLIRNVISGFI